MSKYQVVLNHDWDWASLKQRIWHFSPVPSIEDAEIQAQSMLARGIVTVGQIGLACLIGSDRHE